MENILGYSAVQDSVTVHFSMALSSVFSTQTPGWFSCPPNSALTRMKKQAKASPRTICQENLLPDTFHGCFKSKQHAKSIEGTNLLRQ